MGFVKVIPPTPYDNFVQYDDGNCQNICVCRVRVKPRESHGNDSGDKFRDMQFDPLPTLVERNDGTKFFCLIALARGLHCLLQGCIDRGQIQNTPHAIEHSVGKVS